MSTYDDDPTPGSDVSREFDEVFGTEDAVPPPPPPPDPPQPPRAPDGDRAPASGGRHPVNIGHLVMGLVFLTYVALWGLVQTDVVEGGDIRFLQPIPWVVGGAGGLAVALLGGRRRRTR